MHIYTKSKAQITAMREGGKIHAEIMQHLKQNVKPGVFTEDLNKIAETLMKKNRVISSFKGYKGFPKSICVNINEEIVHGIPSKKRVIQTGDLVKLDMGIYYKGMHTDAGVTVIVGEVSEITRKLVEITRECLYNAIAFAKDGILVNQIGKVVSETAHRAGFQVVRDLTGHGIGREMHEDPEVPNFFRKFDNTVLKSGMTIAIEPMINIGTWEICDTLDGWTIVTADDSLSAYWEHTVLITENGGEILTKL